MVKNPQAMRDAIEIAKVTLASNPSNTPTNKHKAEEISDFIITIAKRLDDEMPQSS